MSTTPGGSRGVFVAIWCAIVIATALVALGGYLSISHHRASLLCSAGVIVYAIGSRALRATFGAAGFATGSTRSRVLVAYVVFLALALGAVAVSFVHFFISRATIQWWDAPLAALVFSGLLGASVLSYRYGVDYRKRDRPAPADASAGPGAGTTKGADASHPRPSLHS